MAKQNEWLVYFYQNRDFHKHTAFFKKGFKHCGVMGYEPESKTWLLIEYLFGQLVVEVLTDKKVDAVFALVKKTKGHIVKVPIKHEIAKFPLYMGSWIKEHSCVSYVQRLIGIANFWIFTPYQLYCELKKKGFHEIEL